MSNEPKWEKARIRTREAEIVRAVAAHRGEKFIDALYHMINFYWDYKRGLLPHSQFTPQMSVPIVEEISTPEDETTIDVDLDLFT
ncbi:MAG: hypothetical protein KME28_04300 [Pelatocladus maniniholoensis HA4357-MV3]|jgi:hypothetical protein|uniref:Uncharacterized protein n=1 Tax=Pelatocladus maniniholoensis HA4357-MV3 TaxID=1117104 RepID=A0A9E3LRY8_9NOST|nr:hypothetical protein [Pelatocladus maniniholoensis HA4357-MV3]